MKVHFWGTRGSLPASLTADSVRKKVHKALEAACGMELKSSEEIDTFIDRVLPFAVSGTYGSNTSCVEIQHPGKEYLILDAGSGLRDFSNNYIKTGKAAQAATFHILMSHLHWDHIQGYPFFAPAFFPQNKIFIHAYHKETPRVYREQIRYPTFPVEWEYLMAKQEFIIREECEPFEIAGFKITSIKQDHPGVSYGYRFEKDGKIFVFSSDSEHKLDAARPDYPFVSFFKNADLLVFDAQYSLADATFNKEDWGHSSNVMGVELAARAKVKHLCMFHNEPTASDSDLDEFLMNSKMYGDIYHAETQKPKDGKDYPEKISLAYDGLSLEL